MLRSEFKLPSPQTAIKRPVSPQAVFSIRIARLYRLVLPLHPSLSQVIPYSPYSSIALELVWTIEVFHYHFHQIHDCLNY